MRGDLWDGFTLLAGDFPPTLNTEDDPTTLKANESPSCYGVDCQREGRLASGSCPSGSTWPIVTKTFGGYTWDWFYNRAWRPATATLYWCPPYYDDFNLPHEVGKLTGDANIVELLPVFGRDLLVVTATGSHLLPEAIDPRGTFQFQQFAPRMWAAEAADCTLYQETPFISNTSGLFSMGREGVKEWTRNIRDSLGTFSDKNLRADRNKGLIVGYTAAGVAQFALDVETGKLFDYGTSGFLFTTRTLAQKNGYGPFGYDSLAILLEHGSTAGGTITWESRAEDRDWFSEHNMEVKSAEGQYTRLTVPICNTIRTAHKFAVRITALPSNLYIRSLEVNVRGLAIEAPSE